MGWAFLISKILKYDMDLSIIKITKYIHDAVRLRRTPNTSLMRTASGENNMSFGITITLDTFIYTYGHI
jgi:hypothetical protein